jgi:hypothetical protein
MDANGAKAGSKRTVTQVYGSNGECFDDYTGLDFDYYSPQAAAEKKTEAVLATICIPPSAAKGEWVAEYTEKEFENYTLLLTRLSAFYSVGSSKFSFRTHVYFHLPHCIQTVVVLFADFIISPGFIIYLLFYLLAYILICVSASISLSRVICMHSFSAQTFFAFLTLLFRMAKVN